MTGVPREALGLQTSSWEMAEERARTPPPPTTHRRVSPTVPEITGSSPDDALLPSWRSHLDCGKEPGHARPLAWREWLRLQWPQLVAIVAIGGVRVAAELANHFSRVSHASPEALQMTLRYPRRAARYEVTHAR